MEILKECYFLYQYCSETWNYYLYVYLLKIVVLIYKNKNHIQTIFLPKNIAHLLSYFLSGHFLYLPFHSHCKEYYV